MKTIYMIDDNPAEITLMREKIKEKTDCELIGTTEYQDLIDMSNEKLPDIFIIDLMMPMINGYDIIKRLYEKFKDIKKSNIIIFTGFDDTVTLNKIKSKFGVRVADKNSLNCYNDIVTDVNCTNKQLVA